MRKVYVTHSSNLFTLYFLDKKIQVVVLCCESPGCLISNAKGVAKTVPLKRYRLAQM